MERPAQSLSRCLKKHVTLTGHPVVVQFALEVVLLRPESLQGELELLPVQRRLHAELLRITNVDQSWCTVFTTTTIY